MKKHLPIIFSALMIAALFCGCTGNDSTGATASPDAGVTATPGNTPNTSPDTPNDSIMDDNNGGRGILGDMGDAAGDIADDIGDAARDMGSDLSGSNRRNANTEPTAGADHGATTKR